MPSSREGWPRSRGARGFLGGSSGLSSVCHFVYGAIHRVRHRRHGHSLVSEAKITAIAQCIIDLIGSVIQPLHTCIESRSMVVCNLYCFSGVWRL